MGTDGSWVLGESFEFSQFIFQLLGGGAYIYLVFGFYHTIVPPTANRHH
jgi:hypothetical protein